MSAIYGFLYGQAGVELGRELAERSAWLDPPKPCAVIAGNKSFGLLAPVSWLTTILHILSGENDGTVTVEETKLPGVMSAFATVHASHAALINDKHTERLVMSFLHEGQFPDSIKMSRSIVY